MRVCPEIRADVARADEVAALIEHARSEWGGIDILVCNAGVYGPKGPVESVQWDEWFEAIRINLMGVVLPCRAVVLSSKVVNRVRSFWCLAAALPSPSPF